MATSGIAIFDLTRNELIASALRKVGAVAQGESASAEQISEASEALNVLVKNIEGFRLWKREWMTNTLTAANEVTGTDALVYTCTRTHTSAAADKPITGANYKSYWKQMGSTGGVWAATAVYSAIGEFSFDADVIGIEKAFIRYGGSDTPLTILSFDKYLDITTKDDFGQPSHLGIEQLIRMKGYLWPQPNSTDYILNVLQYTKLEDFDAAGDNPDLLTRWLRYLVFGLAAELGPEYGVPIERQKYFDIKAETLKERLFKNDPEISEGNFVSSCY